MNYLCNANQECDTLDRSRITIMQPLGIAYQSVRLKQIPAWQQMKLKKNKTGNVFNIKKGFKGAFCQNIF